MWFSLQGLCFTAVAHFPCLKSECLSNRSGIHVTLFYLFTPHQYVPVPCIMSYFDILCNKMNYSKIFYKNVIVNVVINVRYSDLTAIYFQ